VDEGLLSLASKAVDELVKALGDRVVAVALFGSWARGEGSDRSDVDFFVVVRGLEGPDGRFQIYHHLRRVLKRDVTVVDVDEGSLFDEGLNITPLLLNIAWDAVILHDPSGRLRELFNRIKRGVEGRLERYRTRDGKYGWRPVGGPLTAIEV